MLHARAWHCMPALQSLKARVSHMISKWVTMRESALVRRYFTVWQRHPHPALHRLAPRLDRLAPRLDRLPQPQLPLCVIPHG
jgi:hypothetical protein